MGDRTRYFSLMGDMEQADYKLKIDRNRGIVLTGPSKVGKTTFLYHLLEKELAMRKYTGEDVFQPKEVVGDARYPGSDFCLVDLPGFEDAKAGARIANSYYIHEAMKRFKEISFVFVVESDSAFMVNRQPRTFINSLNTFTAMFSDNVIQSVVDHVTLCVSKCSKSDNIELLIERISKQLMPQLASNTKSQLLLQEVIKKRRILFFMKPTLKTVPGREMVGQCSTKFWKVDQKEINYHVLMSEEQLPSEQGNVGDYLGMAKKYLEYSEKQLYKMVVQISEATEQIIKKAAASEKDKKYIFVNKWVTTLSDVNCEWKDEEKIHKVYNLHRFDKKEAKFEHFSEFKFIQKYERAVLQQKKDEKDGKSSAAPTEELLEDIYRRGRLNVDELRIWSEFSYVFKRKRIEYRFFVFLTEGEQDKFLKDERIRFESAYEKSFRLIAESMPLRFQLSDEGHFVTALDLLNSLDLKSEDESIKDPDENIRKIKSLKSKCYSRLGELAHDRRRAVDYFGKSLQLKREIRNAANRKTIIIEEAAICSKIGKVLYEAEMYTEALEFFKVCNNCTMIYKCVTAQPSNFSTLVETGDYFASILEFERAKQMYQQAFDESESEEKKTAAWQYKLRVSNDQEKHIRSFAERLSQKQLVNELENPKEAFERVEKAFKFLATSRDLSQSNVQTLGEMLDDIEKRIRAKNMQ